LFDLQISLPSNYSSLKNNILRDSFYEGYYGTSIPSIDKEIIKFYSVLKPLFKRAALWHILTDAGIITDIQRERLNTHISLKSL
jgi:hypothetical protein